MASCWKCSADLKKGKSPRCPSCNAITRAGELRVNGIIRDGDKAVVYVTENGPGHLLADLPGGDALLDALPHPKRKRSRKKGVGSDAFKELWTLVVGDHPLLAEAQPQIYTIVAAGEERFLHIEVHGLPDKPAATPKKSNGVQADSVVPDDAEVPEAPETEPAKTGPKAKKKKKKKKRSDEDRSAPAAAEPAPVAAAPSGPQVELATLPEIALDHDMRLAELKDQLTRVQQDDESRALQELESRLAVPDTARRLAENLFLYATYGRLCASTGRTNDAVTALERAFTLDPRDREVLLSYGDLLGEADQGGGDRLHQVDRNLLLHHRRDLSAEQLSKVYRRLGQHHQRLGELERARTSYERALDARPDDRDALDLLLETVETQGDPEQVIKVRQRLLDQMRDPAGRAMLRVAIGDDYLSRLGDVGRAIDAYEAAISEHPNAPALTRLARIAIEREDWARAVSTYGRMADTLDRPAEQAEALVQCGKIYRHHMWDPARAAEAYERALDLEPAMLEVFRELTGIHVEAERWSDLKDAYERMIRRVGKTENPDANLLAVLWRNLGELHRQHLSDERAALQAFERASELKPQDTQLHEILATMYEELGVDDEESLRRAIGHNEKLLEIDPSRYDALMRMGVLNLRLSNFDPAFCIFRVLHYQGQGTDDTQRFLDKYSSTIFQPPKATIDAQFRRTRLFPEDFDHELAEVLAISGEALRTLLAHDLDYYKLRPKHRVDKKDGLMFNKVYHTISELLGYDEHPPVYEKADLTGMINGSLHPPGFLAGGPVLSGDSEKAVAFTVAKQLMLFSPQSFLVQLRPLRDLQVIFYTVVKTFRPEVNIKLNKDMERVKKAFEKLKPERFDRLREVMGSLLSRGTKINLGGIIDDYEDVANRCGLLFCDDLSLVRKALENEPTPLNPERSVSDRMDTLLQWSVSAGYYELRKDIGRAIS